MTTPDRELQKIPIIRVLAMKVSRGLAHAAGIVAVLDAFPSKGPQQYVGRLATITTPEAWRFTAKIEGVRDHDATISLFFRGLSDAELPIGSRIGFEE